MPRGPKGQKRLANMEDVAVLVEWEVEHAEPNAEMD